LKVRLEDLALPADVVDNYFTSPNLLLRNLSELRSWTS